MGSWLVDTSNRVASEYEEMTSETSSKVSDDNWAYQSPLPSLNLSSRRSNLSRALSPEHANESARFCSGGSSSGPRRESARVSMLLIFRMLQVLLPVTSPPSVSLSRCRDGVCSRSPVTTYQVFFAESGKPIWFPPQSRRTWLGIWK
jgi:hypothetical protein